MYKQSFVKLCKILEIKAILNFKTKEGITLVLNKNINENLNEIKSIFPQILNNISKILV